MVKANVMAVQKALTSNGLNPSDLRDYGFGPNTIKKLMRGNEMKAETLLRVANVLRVPVETIERDNDPIVEYLRTTCETAALRI